MGAQRAYYLADFSDEIIPCGTSLEDWAAWLSQPDEEWGHSEAAKDGDRFIASVYDLYQVSAIQRDGEWVLEPPAPAGTDWMALRFGDGKGWSAEDIAFDMDGLREILEGDVSVHPDCAYFIACAVPQPTVRLEYRGGKLTESPTP